MSIAMGAVIVASGMSACGGGGGEQTKKFEVWSHNSHSKEVITDALSGKYDFSVLKPIYDMYVGIKADSSLYPGAETLDNDAARALFAERNIGMKLAGSYDVGVFNSQFVAKCNWGVAPYPVANEGDRYKQYMGMGGYFALTSKAVEEFGEEDSFAIYKFFHSDDMLKALYQKGMVLPYDYDIVKYPMTGSVII